MSRQQNPASDSAIIFSTEKTFEKEAETAAAVPTSAAPTNVVADEKYQSAEESVLSDSTSDGKSGRSSTIPAVNSLLSDPNSFSDGYVTPNTETYGGSGSRNGNNKPGAASSKFLPYSPFNEDDEYNDFVISDEELGEFIEPDDDDDDDDDDEEDDDDDDDDDDYDEDIQILPQDVDATEAGGEEDVAMLRPEPQKSPDLYEEDGYEADVNAEADDEAEARSSHHHKQRRSMGGTSTPPPPPPPPLPPPPSDQKLSLSVPNEKFAGPFSMALGPAAAGSTTPTRSQGTPVLSFRRIRNEANELAAFLADDKTWRRGGGGGGTTVERGERGERSTSIVGAGNRERTKSTGDKPTLFRYIRNWGTSGTGKNQGTHHSNGPDDVTQSTYLPDLTITRSADDACGGDREDSSEELSEGGDNDNMSEDSWGIAGTTERPWEQPIEWSSFSMVPQRFIPVDTNAAPNYLDSQMMQQQMVEKEGNRLVWEQSLLLQAILQLLTERDQVGVEGSIDSLDNILKKGPLKMLSVGSGRRTRPGTTSRWKVKYVELRQGNLTYYEDSGKGRKTIHLRQADTVVQPSGTHRHQSGFVFELLVQGSPAKFWMASSEEERQAWIRAIQSAMIGDEGPKRTLDLAPHKQALENYSMIRERIEKATTKELYLEAVQPAMANEEPLQIPVEWIREQTRQNLEHAMHQRTANISAHKLLKSSIADFWGQMGQTDFSINGATILRQTQYAAERVVGGLTRCLLEYDKAFTGPLEASSGGQMTELQAVSYARNILQAVLRSKERQDASCAVRYLLQNPDLVVISSPQEEEFVVNLEVSFAGEELPDDLPAIAEEQTGWIKMRRNKQPAKGQNPRFAVLSGSVLSYYEEATPRPHGLRGQMVLSSASLEESKQEETEGEGNHVLVLKTAQNEECFMVFDDDGEFLRWKSAVQSAIDSCTTEKSCSAPSDEKRAGQAIRRSAERVLKQGLKQADGSIRGGIRVIKNATDGSKKLIRGAVGRVGRLRPSRGVSSGQHDHQNSRMSLKRRPSMQMLLNNTTLSGKREPTVQCVVQVTHIFDVCARSEMSIDPEQWISVNAKLYQAFVMMGGQSGRIARGDALVEFDFVERATTNDEEEEEDAETFEDALLFSEGGVALNRGIDNIDEEEMESAEF